MFLVQDEWNVLVFLPCGFLFCDPSLSFAQRWKQLASKDDFQAYIFTILTSKLKQSHHRHDQNCCLPFLHCCSFHAVVKHSFPLCNWQGCIQERICWHLVIHFNTHASYQTLLTHVQPSSSVAFDMSWSWYEQQTNWGDDCWPSLVLDFPLVFRVTKMSAC